MSRSFCLPILLATMSLTCLASGQAVSALSPDGAATTTLPPSLVHIHTGADDQGSAYGIWAAGDAYKVSFHDGATFVPYLGKDYPHSQSLRWRTQSVRAGELELCTAAVPALAHTDLRATYELGGLVEAYDVRHEGVEQTFVLRSRPTANGDLVIRGAIDTALHAENRAASHDEVVFRDANGTPILAYGKATAIDARGRQQPMTTAVLDGNLTLRLDAAWLATATFPLVVDPLLSVFLAVAGSDLVDVEIARDSALNTGNLWHVTSRWASATDADVILRRTNDDGGNQVVNFSDSTNSWSSTEPSLGMHFADGSCVLAFTREFVSNGTRRVRFHKHDRNDNVLQNQVVAIDTGSNNAWRPDVAHDLYQVGAASLVVVFQREGTGAFFNATTSEVWGCTVALAGNGSAGVSFVIADNLLFEDNERPAINKLQAGGLQEWTVAYQVIGNNPALSPHGDWNVMVRRVARNGTVGAPFPARFNQFGIHDMAPRIAGFNDHIVVSSTRSTIAQAGVKPEGANGHEISAISGTWTAGSYQDSSGATLETSPDARLLVTGFDIDRNTMDHYLLTLRSTVTDNVYYRVLGFHAAILRSGTVFQPAAGESSVSGAVTFDDDAGQFLIAYGRRFGGGSATTEVRRYAHPVAPAPTLSGLGCGSGQLQWQGTQLIGSEHSGLNMTNVPAGALMTAIIATAPFSALLVGIPPIVDGCWLLVPNVGPDHIGFFEPTVGPSASWVLRLPTWLDTGTLYFQGVHFDASNSQIFTTQRLNVPIVK